MQKKIETELKFKLKKIPQEIQLEKLSSNYIHQYYFDFTDLTTRNKIDEYFTDPIDWKTIKEVRTRSLAQLGSTEFYLTLKSDGSHQRTEIETQITLDDFNSLSKLPQLGSLEKVRYYMNLQAYDLTIEIDDYKGKLNGLYIAEMEYNPEFYPDQMQIIEIVKGVLGSDILDVTANKRYKNFSLAQFSYWNWAPISGQ